MLIGARNRERLSSVGEFLSYSAKPITSHGKERFDWKVAAKAGLLFHGLSVDLVGIPMAFAADAVAGQIPGVDREVVFAVTLKLGVLGAVGFGYNCAMYLGYRYGARGNTEMPAGRGLSVIRHEAHLPG
jgi:hypothetical protein